MRLILVRHGEAYAGFHGPIAGPTGCAGLTSQGRQQAEALRDHLAASGKVRAEVLLASVLPRAIETASILSASWPSKRQLVLDNEPRPSTASDKRGGEQRAQCTPRP